MRGSSLAERENLPFGLATIDRLYIRARRAQQRRRDRSEVSCCIKYFLFGYNVVFTISGLAFICIGGWAWTEKATFTNINTLAKVVVDPVLMFVIVGIAMFLIGFAGCTGALRENMCLLKFFCFSILVIFLCEVILGVLTFIYKDWVLEQVKLHLKRILVNYWDDDDLRNLIDWVQGDWLRCCGISTPQDWEINQYFNCTSHSANRCGVPFSCCKPQPGERIRNLLCGKEIRRDTMSQFRQSRIYTTGCIEAGQNWFQANIFPVAGVLVGIAIIQIFSICMGCNLNGDIKAQRMKWRRQFQFD